MRVSSVVFAAANVGSSLASLLELKVDNAGFATNDEDFTKNLRIPISRGLEPENFGKEDGKSQLKLQCLNVGFGCQVDPSLDKDAFSCGQGTLIATPTTKSNNGILNVFLHGTGVPPELHSQFLRLSAEEGFHTIGLGWPSLPFDTNSTAEQCERNEAPGGKDCLYNMHEQILIGGLTEDNTPKFWPAECLQDAECKSPSCNGDYAACVPEECSIISLVTMAIAEAGPIWTTQFFDKVGNVRWNKVLFSGHSQGANMAAFASIYLTAEYGSVAGLSLLSGPKGLSEGPPANEWLFQPEDYFFNSRGVGRSVSWRDIKMSAMASQYETSYLDGIIPTSWEAMGLGTPVELPFITESSQHSDHDDDVQLTTLKIPQQSLALVSPVEFSNPGLSADTVANAEGSLYHCSTAIDVCTPKSNPYPQGDADNDNAAVYAQLTPRRGAWSWLLKVKKPKGKSDNSQGQGPQSQDDDDGCGNITVKKECKKAGCSWNASSGSSGEQSCDGKISNKSNNKVSGKEGVTVAIKQSNSGFIDDRQASGWAVFGFTLMIWLH